MRAFQVLWDTVVFGAFGLRGGAGCVGVGGCTIGDPIDIAEVQGESSHLIGLSMGVVGSLSSTGVGSRTIDLLFPFLLFPLPFVQGSPSPGSRNVSTDVSVNASAALHTLLILKW